MTYAALSAILGEQVFAKSDKKRLGDRPSGVKQMPVPKFKSAATKKQSGRGR